MKDISYIQTEIIQFFYIQTEVKIYNWKKIKIKKIVKTDCSINIPTSRPDLTYYSTEAYVNSESQENKLKLFVSTVLLELMVTRMLLKLIHWFRAAHLKPTSLHSVRFLASAAAGGILAVRCCMYSTRLV